MRKLASALCLAGALVSSRASADDAPATAPAAPIVAGQVNLESDAKPVDVNAPPEEAPPPLPYKKTLVIDSSLGALKFLGNFGKVAPTAPWLHTQLGYEIFKWFMIFGEGELAFTDTSGIQDPPKTRTFPLFGFGGGARFTIHFTDRFGVYAQGSIGAMRTLVSKNTLAIIGYKSAETLGLYAGARIGVEWYMVDRHFALGLTSSIRDATGFKQVAVAGSDTPLALDVGASIRYAF